MAMCARGNLVLEAVCLMAAFAFAAAPAYADTVLFRDTFDHPSPGQTLGAPGWSINLDGDIGNPGPRQSGALGVPGGVGYAEWPATQVNDSAALGGTPGTVGEWTSVGDPGVVFGGFGWPEASRNVLSLISDHSNPAIGNPFFTIASPDINLALHDQPGKTLKVNVEIDPGVQWAGLTNPNAGSIASVSVGTAAPTNFVNNHEGVTVNLFDDYANPNGDLVEIWSNGSLILGATPLTGAFGIPVPLDKMWDVSILMDVAAYDGVSPVKVDVLVEGTLVKSFMTGNGWSGNRVTLMGKDTAGSPQMSLHRFDTLEMIQVPEPMTALLLGVGGLLFRRRRHA